MSTTSSVRRLARIPVLVIGLGLLVAGCGINNIPSYEESAKANWSQVLNQYQRRADLIPNLVETVKGYAAQERQVLEEVTNARARATQMQVQIPPDILNNPEAFKRFQDNSPVPWDGYSRCRSAIPT
jgi:LemA protein